MGRPTRDLTGQTFGRLVVLHQVHVSGHSAMWRCRCTCGELITTRSLRLRNGEVTSCGCDVLKGNTRHKMCGSRVYRIWQSMKQRCLDPNSTNYPKYGGRGISVCSRWLTFELFHSDMGDPPTENHTLERCDNSAGYSPDNCIWATPMEQGRNKRNNVLLTHNGKTMTQAEWSRELEIPQGTLYWRRKSGLSDDEILAIR